MNRSKQTETATFAGGCFWCIEGTFSHLDGVTKATSGYTGGSEKNPTYEQVSSKQTGHLEAVEVQFDPNIISYQELLEVFWRNIDPTDENGQFADRGNQYTTAIFYHTEKQKHEAEKSKKQLEQSQKFDKPIVTQILKAGPFYEAEEYHQEYSKKNPIRYKLYKIGSGRDSFINNHWKKQHDL